MNPNSEYSLRQIRIPDKIYLKLKLFCKCKKMSLLHFYEIMLDWFLTEYGQKKTLTFQAGTRNGKLLSLWIKNRQMVPLKHMACTATVSDARVIYTAMILYLQNLPEFSQ